ncbi:TPA: ankyrin repeat domain-containing protein [Burkholderia vietnamiensis]|nr:ankyrin repeat domain-containing protein [Burkholderia vietnamiensis]
MDIDNANQRRKPANDPDAPLKDDMASWVAKNDHERVRDAFERFELPTTHLLHKARSGAMVDLLVSNGADVNELCPNYEPAMDKGRLIDATPLQMVSDWRYDDERKDVFDRLLEHGADIDMGGGDRPLMMALRTSAARGGYGEDVAIALLDRGARAHTEEGEQPVLFEAVQTGYGATVVKRLLEAGADPSENVDGQGTALHHVRDHQPGVVDLLLDYGAKVNAPMGDERITPLEQAVSYGHASVVERLLVRGADYRDLVQKPVWEEVKADAHADKQRIVRAVQSYLDIDKERATLHQAVAEVEQGTSPEVAEQPVARRRARL